MEFTWHENYFSFFGTFLPKIRKKQTPRRRIILPGGEITGVSQIQEPQSLPYFSRRYRMYGPMSSPLPVTRSISSGAVNLLPWR